MLANSPELADYTKQAIEKVKQSLVENKKEINGVKNVEKDLSEFVHFSIGFINNMTKKYWQLNHTMIGLRCKQLVFPQDFVVKKDGKVYTQQISPLIRLASTKKDPENDSESPMVERIRNNLHLILENAAYWREILTPEYNRWKLNGSPVLR
ncbi:hypothetical protein HYX70_03440 [Candidatus Saccharibacteria bacterium]|nr:hypothetical protein [Candidatus Saccharibacteria bacterium]